MDAKTFRTISRAFHLIAAACIGTFVYSPWGSEPGFRLGMQALGIPVLTITGIFLWKQAKAMRLLRLRERASSGGGR